MEEKSILSQWKKQLQYLVVQWLLWDQKALVLPSGRMHRGHPSCRVLLLFLKYFRHVVLSWECLKPDCSFLFIKFGT